MKVHLFYCRRIAKVKVYLFIGKLTTSRAHFQNFHSHFPKTSIPNLTPPTNDNPPNSKGPGVSLNASRPTSPTMVANRHWHCSKPQRHSYALPLPRNVAREKWNSFFSYRADPRRTWAAQKIALRQRNKDRFQLLPFGPNHFSTLALSSKILRYGQNGLRSFAMVKKNFGGHVRVDGPSEFAVRIQRGGWTQPVRCP